MASDTLAKKDALKIFYNLPNRTYEFDTYKILPFAGDPLGFLSEHSQLEIHVKSEEEEEDEKKGKVLKFFMKSVPKLKQFYKKYITEIQVFEKEALLYKEVLHELQSYSNKKFCAECHLTDVNSYIVLEDLSEKGYSAVKDKSVTFDLQHCKCVIDTLARFHASSIILEESNSIEEPYRLLDDFPNALFETTFSYKPGHPRNNWLHTTTNAIIDLSKLISSERHADIKSRLMEFKEAMKVYVAPSQKYRNVVNHADLWSNNFMFKYDENSCPTHCILVDFQLARYVPPAFDFLTFLYLNTTADFCTSHFSLLADLYYQIFASQLTHHGLNAENICSKCVFLESCEFYRAPALLEAVMFGTIVYINGNFCQDMLTDEQKFNDFMFADRSKFVCDLFKNDHVYRKRITNVVTQLLNVIL